MYRFITIGLFFAAASAAAISERTRLYSAEQVVGSIVNDCLDGNGMNCIKEKVLTYLDTILGLESEQSRSFDQSNIDRTIYDRVSRVLANNEIRVQLPQILFGDAAVTYNSADGLDFEVNENPEAARGLLKKKLLFPVLLLLKLKMKALMPVLLAIVGLKATKALILSKLAITIVLGFVIAQLVKKTGLGMPMSMMPMMPAAPEPPMPSYGPPTTPQAPDSSYGPAAWNDSTGAGSSYSRVWEPSSAQSSHNLAYSSYYPSSAVYEKSVSPSSSSSASSSSSSSSSPSMTAKAY